MSIAALARVCLHFALSHNMLNLATQQNPVVVLLLGGGGVFCFLFPAFVPFWLLFWSPLTWNKNLESGGRSGSYQVSLHSGRAVVAANELFPEATTTTKKNNPEVGCSCSQVSRISRLINSGSEKSWHVLTCPSDGIEVTLLLMLFLHVISTMWFRGARWHV